MVERFNAIADRGNIDFEAWFNQVREPDRSWDVTEKDWRFRARYIPKQRFFGQSLHLPLKELQSTQPDVVVSLYDRASFAIGSLAVRASASRTAYRVLPNYDSWSNRTWWREASKHFLFRSIDGSEVPGPDGAELAVKYGLSASQAYKVTQSINVAHYWQARNIDQVERNQQREKLGLKGCVFIYVGRLWSGKGLDYLLDAYRTVRKKQTNVSLLIVGDGIEENRYRHLSSDLSDVIFTGFIQPREIPNYYALADAFIFPTLGDPHGLVVEEAMAAGLPVISTEAAGDIHRRICDGQDGFIVPPCDSETLAERMVRLATEPALRSHFASQVTDRVIHRGHEIWAKDFEQMIEGVLASPRRQTLSSRLASVMGRSILWLSAIQHTSIDKSHTPTDSEIKGNTNVA